MRALDLVGTTLHHAFVLTGQGLAPTNPRDQVRTADGRPLFDYASNAEPLRVRLQHDAGRDRSATPPP